MRFRVLGPVEVNLDGDWRSPGAPKQRVVLATLVLEAGRTVSVDRLVDEVWGERAPRTAGKNLQVYVWHLRKFLGDRLESRGHGYRLLALPDEIDAARFAAGTATARQARRAGALDEAAAVYGAALGLWRGPALADLAPAGLLGAEAARLNAERLQATREWIDVELALGAVWGSDHVVVVRSFSHMIEPLRCSPAW